MRNASGGFRVAAGDMMAGYETTKSAENKIGKAADAIERAVR
jgi:hypothetical protein